jgi:hypothetical protein
VSESFKDPTMPGKREIKVEGILTDEDIMNELNRYRARNTAAELATLNVKSRARRENLQCRQRIKKLHSERLRKEYENSLAHLKTFQGMYDHSPFRYDVVAMRQQQKAKRVKEERLQAEMDKTYNTLAAMNGTDEEFIARKVPSKVLHNVVDSVDKQLVLQQRLVEVDAIKIAEELKYLDEMVDKGLQDTMERFKCCRDANLMR